MFNRSVSANFGMSYSISNVLAEAGLANILRWVPFEIDESELRDRIKNKMIRPTTIPCLLEDLKIEQAIAREALRLAFLQHKQLAVGLKGMQRGGRFPSRWTKATSRREPDQHEGPGPADRQRRSAVARAAAVAGHDDAHRRLRSPRESRDLAVDSIFMMPHLGVLAQVHESAAAEVFEHDCLIHLGTCVSPLNTGQARRHLLRVPDDGRRAAARRGSVPAGEIVVEPLAVGQTANLVVQPARSVDVGAGRGKALSSRSRRSGRRGFRRPQGARWKFRPPAGPKEWPGGAKAFDAYPN